MAVGGNITVENNALAKQLGLASGTSNTVASGAATTLNVQLDGKASLAIDLSSLGANAKMSDITKAINDALKADTADYGAAYGSASTANLDGSITLTGVSGGGNVTVTNSALSNTLGLTANSSNKSVSGAAAQTLGINIDGKGTTQVDFSKMVGGTQSLTAIAGAINSQLSAAYGAGYANLASANPDGTISIASKATGSTAGTVTVTNDAAGKSLGLTSGPAANVTKNGKDESLSDVVSFLNTTAQKALGTSTDAKIVSMDANGKITIASQTKGANSSVTVVGAGTTAGLASALNLTEDVAKTGQARSMSSVVADLQQAFNSNTTLQQAGLTAQVNASTGSLEIKSSNGTQFSLDAWGTQSPAVRTSDSAPAVRPSPAPTLTAQSSSSVIDTQGASAIGTFANAKNSTSISFQNMQFGNDDQSITISASSAGGVAQTPLTITLQNDSTAQTGANIDSAISAINTKLQQSENATMRSITAVRETSRDRCAEHQLRQLSLFLQRRGECFRGRRGGRWAQRRHGEHVQFRHERRVQQYRYRHAGRRAAGRHGARGCDCHLGQRASHHRPRRKPVDLRHQPGHVPDHQLLGCGIGNSRYQRSPAGGQPLQSPDLVAGCHSCHGPGQLRASGGSQPPEGLILTTNPAEGLSFRAALPPA